MDEAHYVQYRDLCDKGRKGVPSVASASQVSVDPEVAVLVTLLYKEQRR
jgi:hypothetical protein